MKRIVIVGNGIAGLTAADSLRAGGFDGDLTLIGGERHQAYSRPALSKALLRDHDDDTSHELAPAAHGATELLGVGVSSLDTERRTVGLTNGGEVPYDGLVITTGCRARRLGPADSGEVTLRTLDDALLLRSRIAGRPTVIVVGGGPLGMEIASGCVAGGCEVTLVSNGAPLRTQLGDHLSRVFCEAAVRQGLKIVTGSVSTVWRGEDGSTVVGLRDGSRFTAELVVTAAGDVPNVEWLRPSGLVRGDVIEVDERCRVRPGIVAAGDVAAVPTTTGVRRIPLWNSAIDQAKVAASALLDGDDAPVLNHRPYFWTEQFGLSLKAIGDLPLAGEPALVDGDPSTDSLLLRWDGTDGSGAAAAVNYRIPIPRLRKLCMQPA